MTPEVLRTDIGFAAYMFLFGMLGAWAVYYCLSPLTPQPDGMEILGAVLYPIASLLSLWAVNRQ